MKTGQKWPVTAVTDVDLKKKKKKSHLKPKAEIFRVIQGSQVKFSMRKQRNMVSEHEITVITLCLMRAELYLAHEG